jgi:very-short-patch-repair endonuclease
MNAIEQRFYDAGKNYFEEIAGDYMDSSKWIENGKVIGPYRVDFYYEEPVQDLVNKFVIEIDGHESHKTKEQRDSDYKRERYLQKNGYHVIRFMGTEVFLDALSCVEEFLEVVIKISELYYLCFKSGYNCAVKQADKK